MKLQATTERLDAVVPELHFHNLKQREYRFLPKLRWTWNFWPFWCFINDKWNGTMWASSPGNTRSQSSQLAEPLWTNPGVKSGISVRKLISTYQNKNKKKRRQGMNCRTFSPNSRTRGKTHRHVANAGSCVGPQIKIGHPVRCHRRLMSVPLLSAHGI